MNNIFSNTLFLVQEGPELSGKSSAVARLGQVIEHALPTLIQNLGTPIHFKKIREPGGSPKGDRGRRFIINILGLQAIAQKQLSDATLAELFTWARCGLYDELVPEIEETEGINILLGDRSYLSMMVLQGEWPEKPSGVSLNELEESASWATKGLLPDVVLLRKFPELGLAENISFRQLMILLTGREVMPQDLSPHSEFEKVQNRFDELANRYMDSVKFYDVDAVSNPLVSTERELDILTESIVRKFPTLTYETVLATLFSSYELLKREGKFVEVQSMVEEQEAVRNILKKRGVSAEQVMSNYREGDEGVLTEIRRIRDIEVEISLPLQARK